MLFKLITAPAHIFHRAPFTSMTTSSSNVLPALSSLCSFTKTFPVMIIALAFSLDSANPLFTRSTSSLSFFLMLFHSASIQQSSLLCSKHLSHTFSFNKSTLPCSMNLSRQCYIFDNRHVLCILLTPVRHRLPKSSRQNSLFHSHNKMMPAYCFRKHCFIYRFYKSGIHNTDINTFIFKKFLLPMLSQPYFRQL